MASYSWDRVNSQDGLATTSVEDFPLGLVPYEGNLVLPLGAPGDSDGLHAGKPHIQRTADRHHHFYTAVEPGPC